MGMIPWMFLDQSEKFISIKKDIQGKIYKRREVISIGRLKICPQLSTFNLIKWSKFVGQNGHTDYRYIKTIF